MILESYALSPLQRGMLFNALFAPGSGVDVEQIVGTLHHELDVPALARAWARVIARHAVLRTSFRWHDVGSAVQEVHTAIDCSLKEYDWRSCPAAEQTEQLEAFLHDDRQRGFALDVAPLMRLALFRRGGAEYTLVWTLHHILLDGRSFPLVLQEVFAFYDAFSRGRDLDLTTPRPYRDYIDWLARRSDAASRTFWQQLLAGFTTPTTLRTGEPAHIADPSEPDASLSGYGVEKHLLSKALTGALGQLASQLDVSLNTLVQGAWAILLSRYSGDEDVLFGATRACRRSALDGVGTEAMLGLFINTLPVRVVCAPGMRVSQWLQESRAQSLAVRPHEHTPLPQVQEWSGIPHGAPLFESLVVYENETLHARLQAQGGQWLDREFDLREQTNYPLTLAAYGGAELLLRLEYDPKRFSADASHRMVGHLAHLLEQFVAAPDGRLSELELVTATERRQLVVEWNAAVHEDADEALVHDLFSAQAARTPDAVAAVYGDRSMTFGELELRSNQLAHHLQELGVGPERVVGVCFGRSPELLVALLGILKAGGAYLALDASHPPERVAFMLDETRSPVLVTESQMRPVPGYGGRVVCLAAARSAIAEKSVTRPVSTLRPDNIAYVIYTSGSTGKPKGVMIPHRGFANYLRWATRAYATDGRGTIVHSPISFDLTITSLFFPLLTGQTAHLVPEEDGVEGMVSAFRRRKNLGLIKITPAHLQVMNQLIPDGEASDRCRVFVIGGEALLAEQVAFWRTHAPNTRLVNEYGPTETVVGCCVYEVNADTATTGAVPIGRPIANTQLYILDRDLHPAPIGVTGELYIGGAGLARGYVNRPDLTAERFIPNPFADKTDAGVPAGARLYRTGDLARYRPDGNIEFLGRTDRQVKVRGFRIELEEIESLLRQHPAVRDAVVVVRETDGAPSRKQLVAYVILDDTPTLPKQELRDYLRGELPDYMVPTAFVRLDSFPLTSNGKLDPKSLPTPACDTDGEDADDDVPATPAEKALAKIWQDVLGLESVRCHDNFFELGGDSILSIQIAARAGQAGLHVTPRQVFQYQTISELAAVADSRSFVKAEHGPVTGSLPLTPIQHWFFERGLLDPHHWNQAVLLEARQPVQVEALREAIRHLVLHHDALRLRFGRTRGGWRQFMVPPTGDVPFSYVNLTGLSPSERQNVFARKAAELQSSLNLEKGPLIRVVLFDPGAGLPPRVLSIVHHLAVDGVSWRIMYEDMHRAYEQVLRGDAIQLPPKTTSFKQWAECLSEYAQSPAVEAEFDYWRGVSWGNGARLPRDYPVGAEANTVASSRRVVLGLEPDETWALLHDAAAAYGTQINDLLLTALVQAFAQWTGSESLFIDLEGHGREEIVPGIDLSRTVGWFTTVFPVCLTLAPETRLDAAVRSIKEQLRRVPDKGMGYGILRYLHGGDMAAALSQQTPPSISFNYFGQFDTLFANSGFVRILGEHIGRVRSRRDRRRYLINIDGHVDDSRLEFQWTYSENIHRRETIEQVAGGFLAGLRALIAGARSHRTGVYTPSDFPEAGLSQTELDALISQLQSNDESIHDSTSERNTNPST